MDIDEDDLDFEVKGVDDAQDDVFKFLEKNFEGKKVEKSEEPFTLKLSEKNFDAGFETFQFDEDGDFRDIAEEIVGKARIHAIHSAMNKATARGHRFTLSVVKEEAGVASLSSRGASINFFLSTPRKGEIGAATARFADENLEPSEKGVLEQQMAFSAKLFDHSVTSFGDMLKSKDREIHELKSQVRQYEKDRFKSYEMYEGLIAATHARELEAKRMEKDDQRKEAMLGIAQQAAPFLLNKFVGAKVLAEEASPMEQMLMAYAGTFTPEQLNELMTTGRMQFRQDQSMGFLQLMSVLKEKEEAKAAAAAQATAAAAQGGGQQSPQH
jgi:hypothetical protein